MKVGIVGWRGMVGSVLLNRMIAEGDFDNIDPTFFSTSQAGASAPDIGKKINNNLCQDANDIEKLAENQIIISTQGGDYTKEIHPKLRQANWNGFWIDAASTLRMADNSMIVLDPVNRDVIDNSLRNGIKDYIGGNCTVSLLLMALIGLIRSNQVEWISSMTYQAASGAGAPAMRELLLQMQVISQQVDQLLHDPKSNILTIDQEINNVLSQNKMPIEKIGYPLAGNVLPWIDSELPNGQSREEWKGGAEANKILALPQILPIDGLCIRVGTLRCHSQALTIKLKSPMSIDQAEEYIKNGNQWVKFVPNHREQSLNELSPAAVSGKLDIKIGRLREMNLGKEYLSCFTVGDQLLWGAAEPLRRILRIIIDNKEL